MYKRKTTDEFNLYGNYGEGFKVLTCELTRKDIIQRKKEYQKNSPEGIYKWKKERVPITGKIK